MEDKKNLKLIRKQEQDRELKPAWFINPYIKAATSNHTRKAYRSDITHFENWGGKLPASPEIVTQYLESYAAELNPRTLARRLIALKHWHTYQGFPDPTVHPAIQKTMAGIMRIHGKPKNKARPIMPEEVNQIATYLHNFATLTTVRNKALILIGYFGALRRSELVAIAYENIHWQTEGIEILLPTSKTDPEHQGQFCVIPYGVHVSCPIQALKAWLELSQIKSGPIFRAITASGKLSNKELSPLSVNLILKECAKNAGIPEADAFSSHSLRRGLATSAARAGVPLHAIMRAGRWKQTNTVVEYIEATERFTENAASNVIKHFLKKS